MKFAAIDIGSNAARLQISSVLENDGVISFKRIEYVRFALRLGHDVQPQRCEKRLIQQRLLRAYTRFWI